MKANVNTKPETTVTPENDAILNDILKTIPSGMYRMFYTLNKKRAYIVQAINSNSGGLYMLAAELRKQGSGKRNKIHTGKCIRIAHNGIQYIMDSASVETRKKLNGHTFDGNVKTVDVTRALPIFNQFIDTATDRLNEVYDNIDNKATEEPPVVEDVIEDAVDAMPEETPVEESVDTDLEVTLLDRLCEIITPATEKFADRLVSLPLSAEILDKLTDFDSKLVYCQELCIKLNEVQKRTDVIKVNIAETETAIANLNKKLSELKIELAEAQSTTTQLKNAENSVDVYSIYKDIDSVITELEIEASEAAQAEKKAAEIASSLSDAEREALLRLLGINPEPVEVIKTTTRDITVSLINGATKKIDVSSMADIRDHVKGISSGNETPNREVFEYLAEKINNGMTQKDLVADAGMTPYYAKQAFDYCRKFGLIAPKRTYTRHSVDASKRAAETRSKVASVKREKINESFSQ